MRMWRKPEYLCTVGGIVKWGNHYGDQYKGSSKNRTTILPSNFTSGYIPRTASKVLQRYVHTHDTAALITIAKRWKQAKCQSTDE